MTNRCVSNVILSHTDTQQRGLPKFAQSAFVQYPTLLCCIHLGEIAIQFSSKLWNSCKNMTFILNMYVHNNILNLIWYLSGLSGLILLKWKRSLSLFQVLLVSFSLTHKHSYRKKNHYKSDASESKSN